MNCRQIAKILPELAAEELDDAVARDAKAHIDTCQSCAAEFTKYQEVMEAVSSPWETLEEPDDLVLHLPQPVNQPVFRTRLGLAAGFAVVLLIVLLALPQDQKVEVTYKQKAPKIVKIPEAPVIKHPAPESDKDKVVRISDSLVNKPIAQVPKRIKKETRIEKQTPKKVVVQVKREQKQAVDTTIDHPVDTHPTESETKPAIVIASLRPLDSHKPSLEIKSVDQATGEVQIYRIVYDESGDNPVTSITFTPSNISNRREDL